MQSSVISRTNFIVYTDGKVWGINTLRPRLNGSRFADDTFKRIFLNENVLISIKTSVKCVLECSINNIPALVQEMAWCRPGAKPLSEPMIVRLSMRICDTRPQWVNGRFYFVSAFVNEQKLLLGCHDLFHFSCTNHTYLFITRTINTSISKLLSIVDFITRWSTLTYFGLVMPCSGKDCNQQWLG